MRVLAAFKNGVFPPGFKASFKKFGLVADVVDYEQVNDVHDDLDFSGPYSILMHDDGLKGEVFDDVLSRAPVYSRFFNRASRQGRFDPDVIIRNAFVKLSLARGGSKDGVITAGAFEVNLLEGTAKVDGKPLGLSPSRFSVLRTLVVHGYDQVISRDDIKASVYGLDHDFDSNVVTRAMYEINKEISHAAGDAFRISPYFKRGYMLEAVAKKTSDLVGGMSFCSQSGTLSSEKGKVQLEVVQANALGVLAKGGIIKSKHSNRTVIKKLRAAMRDLTGVHYIRSHYGIGYLLSQTPVPESGTRLAMIARKAKAAAPK